jgi:hypothetical protein
MDEDFEISHMKTPNSGETLVEESHPSILIPEKGVILSYDSGSRDTLYGKGL